MRVRLVTRSLGLALVLGLGLALGAVAGACGSSWELEESGFLPDYSRLHEEDAPSGGRRRVYANPNFTPARYTALLIEPLRLYPEPQPSEHVSIDVLKQIRSYADLRLRQKIGERVTLVSTPGPGVARLQAALTAVGAETEALAAYQYIPIALVVTGALALAEGGRPEDAKIAIELQVTDSVSREPLLYLVRGGAGARIESVETGERQVGLESLEGLLEHWTDAAAAQVTQYVKAR